MRVKVLFLVLLIGVLGLPRLGHAEKVKTNQNTKVYNRPGEQGKVVAKVREGQNMTLLAKEGRWLKVRVSGRTGYVPRSKVEMSDDEEISRNTRRRPFVDGRSTKRGFGGSDVAPEDRIGADATEPSGGDDDGDDGGDEGGDDDGDTGKGKGKKGGGDDDEDPIGANSGDEGADEDEPTDAEEEETGDDRIVARVSSKTQTYDDPDDESEKSFKATPGDALFVVEKKGKWTLVETDEGDVGYVQTSKLEIEGSDDGDDEGGGKRGRIIDVRGRLGVTLVGQTLTSTGGTAVWPDRYRVGSSAAAISVGGAVLYPYKSRFYVGGELAYDIAKALPGVAFDQGGAGPMPKQTTGFTIHNFNLRAVGLYDLKNKRGMMLLARVGLHYESFLVANVDNLTKNSAKLPSEVVKGPMLGVGISIPKITGKIGLRFSLDAMLVGASVTQTKNLEDGANPSAKRITFGTGFTYRWKPSMDIQATYDLNYGSMKFGAPVANSQRMHTGTSVSRTDINHTVALGVAKAF
jgi:hypothetical protein